MILIVYDYSLVSQVILYLRRIHNTSEQLRDNKFTFTTSLFPSYISFTSPPLSILNTDIYIMKWKFEALTTLYI